MKQIVNIIIAIALLVIIAAFGISAYVTIATRQDIALIYNGSNINSEETNALAEVKPQCILVLGCAVWADNQPSPMLKDRLDTAIALYKQGIAPKLLFSGDNSTPEYSEPDCMYQYALNHGVADEDIFLDFAGFSTYDTMYRAKAVFCVDRMIIVTQKYHLYRALKIAKSLGIDAKGAAAAQRKYKGRYNREMREVLARDKDLFKCLIKPEPKFLGEKIPVDGDGRVTHVN